jgi:hypothetical protein
MDHIAEEPGSGKLLRPVLETNGTGDLVVEFKRAYMFCLPAKAFKAAAI